MKKSKCYNKEKRIVDKLLINMKRTFAERKGKLEDHNRSFDLQFWQNQSPEERMKAAMEMVEYVWKISGGDVRQLRLQRSVENFQRQQG